MCFSILPDEILTHIFSYLPGRNFHLRQVCSIFRGVLPPQTLENFRDEAYARGDLPLIRHYRLPSDDHNIVDVLRGGHKEVFDYAFPGDPPPEFAFYAVEGGDSDIVDRFTRRVRISSLAEATIVFNKPRLIDHLHDKHGYIPGISEVELTIRHGCTEILDWLREGGYLPHPEMYWEMAASSHSLTSLRWLLAGGYPLPEEFGDTFCVHVGLSGDMGMLQFALDNCIPLPPDLFTRSIARGGSVEMMKWAIERGYPMGANLFKTAAKSGHLSLLDYLYLVDCPVPRLDGLVIGDEVLLWLERFPPMNFGGP